jgi:site-specific recombinase XerD
MEKLDVYKNPEFIQVSDDMVALKNYVLGSEKFTKRNQTGHINSALDLLIHVLWELYEHTKYSVLVRRSDNVTEGEHFCEKCKMVMDKKFNWGKSTQKIIFGCMKNIMKETSVNPWFINRLSLASVNTRDVYDIKNLIPSDYKKFDYDSKVIITLKDWFMCILKNSKNRSPVSLTHIFYFICKYVLPVLKIDLELIKGEIDVPEITVDLIKKMMNVSDKEKRRRIGWVKLFLKSCLNMNNLDDDLFLTSHYVFNNSGCGDGSEHDLLKVIKKDNSDVHRISVEELEKLHKVSKSVVSVRNELIFMLLITTGMRVGGLVKILLDDICVINGSDLIIKDYGKTIEKGNKWFSFSLTPHVKHLLSRWIKEERVCNGSKYIFPARTGRTGYLTTDVVRKMFSKLKIESGCEGKHIHVHSIRHSFAHILLENGNSIEVVSKLMGHTSVSTTQSYYLKENAIEVAQRANIPWLTKSHEVKKITPDFLQPLPPPTPLTTPTPPKKTMEAMAVRKRRQNMSRIMSFTNDRLKQIADRE